MSGTRFPSAAPRPSMVWPVVTAAVLVAGLLVVYPPFRVVSRTAPAAMPAAAAGPFEPAAFAAKFWAGPLQAAATSAPEAGPLLRELGRDPAAALARARRVGLGNAAYFLARGEGKVVAVERSRLLLEIGGTTVALRTGPVFGNVVRDGCGLLDVNQAPGLAEFNAVSAELNRLVEERVQPALRSVPVGAVLAFAGCAEAPEVLPDSGPVLTFIPLSAGVNP